MSASNELHYTVEGKRQDVDLHSPILEEGDTSAAFIATYAWLRGEGWSDERIEVAYPSAFAQMMSRSA